MTHQLRVMSKRNIFKFSSQDHYSLLNKVVIKFETTFANVVKASVSKKGQILETNNVFNTTEIDLRFELHSKIGN